MGKSTTRQVNLASDNTAVAAPEILQALVESAGSPTMPYGDDDYSRRLTELASSVFEREVAIYPVATGTAANALSLASVSPPYGVVWCHEGAHIEEDECAAPEFYMGGGKLALLGGENGQFSASELCDRVAVESPAPQVHRAQAAAVSISQSTELGTLYPVSEIAAISAICDEHGLVLHMDGARLANAISALGISPAEVTWKSGVDVLSLGATKNGALAAEAVVFFAPTRAQDFEFRRKRGGHLFSKMRFLSAQLIAYLQDNNWIRYATQANARAAELADGLRTISGITIEQPVHTNMIFLTMPRAMVSTLSLAGCEFYSWGTVGGSTSARLVTNFATTSDDIAYFLDVAGAWTR